MYKKDNKNDSLLNYNELNKPICKSIIIKDILKESENKLLEIYELEYFYKLIDENSDEFYLNDASEFISLSDENESELLLDIKYCHISSDEYSVLTLLKLFDEISYEIIPEINNYKFSENEYKYNKSELLDLYYEILSELNYKGFFNYYYSDKNYYKFKPEILLEDIKIKLNISENNLLSNKHLFLNDELIDSEISNILINDIDSSILHDINNISYFSFKSDEFYEYLSGILEIYPIYEINKYKLFESCIIDFYNDEFSANMKYSYENKPDYFYKNNVEYYLELSLLDLFKLNEIISDASDLIFNLNDADNKNIFNLIENTNNSIDSDSFIYGILDNLSEYLYSEFYDEYYYELSKINSSNYNYMKIKDIYELIEIVLNEFKHYNLSNSFKFSDDVYELQ